MEYYWSIVNWDSIGLAFGLKWMYESNDALFERIYGNSLFAITTDNSLTGYSFSW